MGARVARKLALATVGTVVMGMSTSAAKAAEALWISAPNWSYSAAAAASPVGTAYFWGLSVGAGTYSFAYAYSHDAPVGSADAFAEASAGGLGGMAAVDAAGVADPFAGVGIDISLTDPSIPGDYPDVKPGTDPLSSAYTVDTVNDQIDFTSGSGEELNGTDELEAFLYTGETTDDSALKTDLDISSDNGSGNGANAFVDGLTGLGSDFIPLDAPIVDPGSLSQLDFTENLADLAADGSGDVILVGVADAAAPVPGALPAGLALLGLGGAASLLRKRRAA